MKPTPEPAGAAFPAVNAPKCRSNHPDLRLRRSRGRPQAPTALANSSKQSEEQIANGPSAGFGLDARVRIVQQMDRSIDIRALTIPVICQGSQAPVSRHRAILLTRVQPDHLERPWGTAERQADVTVEVREP